MSEKKNTIRHSEATMYPLVELYNESSMTQKGFCTEMEIAPHTLSYWLMKYRKKTNLEAQPAPKFQALNISNAPIQNNTSRLIRITYPDGTKIELPFQ